MNLVLKLMILYALNKEIDKEMHDLHKEQMTISGPYVQTC